MFVPRCRVCVEALAETAKGSTGVGSWSGRFVVNVTGTCSNCPVTRFDVMLISLEPPIDLFVDYPVWVWRGIIWINVSWCPLVWIVISEPNRLIGKINVLVMLQRADMHWALVIEVSLLLIRQWSWLHGHSETGVVQSTAEQLSRWW